MPVQSIPLSFRGAFRLPKSDAYDYSAVSRKFHECMNGVPAALVPDSKDYFIFSNRAFTVHSQNSRNETVQGNLKRDAKPIQFSDLDRMVNGKLPIR